MGELFRKADLGWYGSVYSDMRNRFHILGMAPEESATELINRFHLCEDTGV